MARRLLIPFLFMALIFCQCKVKINQSIHVRSDRHVSGSQISVNGSVTVGSNCIVRGDCKSVNGSIHIGSSSTVGDVQSVNGSIDVGSDTKINGGIASVNGNVDCAAGVKVKHDIKTVNGSMALDSVMVLEDLVSYNGNIRLVNGTQIKGDIKIKSGKNNSPRRKPIYIDISDRSVVEGNVIVNDPDVEVKIFLKNGGQINGDIENAEVIEEESISSSEDEHVDF